MGSKFEDWLKKVESPPCPECGKRETLQLKKDKSNETILQTIPGN